MKGGVKRGAPAEIGHSNTCKKRESKYKAKMMEKGFTQISNLVKLENLPQSIKQDLFNNKSIKVHTTDVTEILKILKGLTSFDYYVARDLITEIQTIRCIRCSACKGGNNLNFKILFDDQSGEYIELEPVPGRMKHIHN
jgi:hypothetical protein